MHSRIASIAAAISILVLAGAATAQEAAGPLAPNEGAWRPVLEAAVATGDDDVIADTAKSLKALYPDEVAYIDALTPVPPPPPEYGFFDLEGWDGEIELTVTQAQGNSENTAFGGAMKAVNEFGRWTHAVSAYADFGGADGERTQERFGGMYQVDMTINDRAFAYNKIEYEDDRFSGFAYRIFYTAGLGYFFIDNDRAVWKGEAGPGVRYSSIQQTPDADPNSPTFGQQIPLEDSSTDFAAFASSDLSLKLTDTTDLAHEVDVTYTDTTTTLTSKLAIDTRINGHLSLRVSGRVRYETDPPSGRENTDTVVKASLLFRY